ncbi:MAG: peptidyl-prolyl cis-trans isomerase [candidate division WOR-3 bacterium]
MKRTFIMFILLTFCTNVKKQTEEKDVDIIAKVGDIKITEKDLKIGLENLPGIELTKEQKESLKDELIKTAVFYLAAKEEKLDTNSNINLKIEWIKRSILAQEYLKMKYGNRAITPEEVENFIKSNISKFSKKFNIIFVQFLDTTLKNEIKELLLDLNRTPVAGKKLDDMVRKGIISAQPMSINLGIASFDFSENVINDLLKANKNDVLGPYKVQNSYIFVKVVDKLDDNPNTNEIKQAVFQILTLKDQQKFMDSLYNALKGRYVK